MGATSWWSETPTRRSTPSGGPTSGASPSSPSGSPRRRSEPAPIMTLRTSRRCSTHVLQASRASLRLLGAAGSLPVSALRAAPISRVAGRATAQARSRCGSSPTVEREAAVDRRDPAPRAPAARHAVVADGGARPLGSDRHPGAAAGPSTPRAFRSRWPPTSCPCATTRRWRRCSPCSRSPRTQQSLTPDQAQALLLRPRSAARSPSELRRLGRALREAHRQRVDADPPPSSELVLCRPPRRRSCSLELPDALTGRAARARPRLLASGATGASCRAVGPRPAVVGVVRRRCGRTGSTATQTVRGRSRVRRNRTLDALVVLFDLARRSQRAIAAG